jgi:hypothetical protein
MCLDLGEQVTASLEKTGPIRPPNVSMLRVGVRRSEPKADNHSDLDRANCRFIAKPLIDEFHVGLAAR